MVYLDWYAIPLTDSSHMNQGPTFQLIERNNQVKNELYSSDKEDPRATYGRNQIKLMNKMGKVFLHSRVKIALALNDAKLLQWNSSYFTNSL